VNLNHRNDPQAARSGVLSRLPIVAGGPRLRLGLVIAAGSLLTLSALAGHAADKAAKRGTTPARLHRAAPQPTAALLSYDLKPGSSHRYHITAFFSGHFPPFSQPGGQPINLRTRLTYIANVKKVDAKGAQVAFVVDAADISLLEKDPGPGGKVNPDDEAPWPIPLQEVQQALNVTAILRPDGSIASIEGGNAPPVKIDIGFDLRKLFLLMMPVTFPDKPVRVNEPWTFADGLLGNKPGKVTYTGRLEAIDPTAKRLLFHIHQNGQAAIEDSRDKAGKVAANPADAVDTTTGKVTVEGDLLFVAPTGDPAAAALANGAARGLGRLQTGHLVMSALLTRKRAAPDPEHPEEPQESQIDVHARLSVQADDSPHKAPSAAAGGHNATHARRAGTTKEDKSL
jgi:hypothetical protein